MAWAESGETSTTSATSRLWRIDPSEILEHESPLLRTQPLQLFPRGIPESRTRARGARLQCRRQMNAIPRRRTADALFVLVRLVVREGRSEERRVGKECRCRWWRCGWRKKM